jgi:hypothetical protein
VNVNPAARIHSFSVTCQHVLRLFRLVSTRLNGAVFSIDHQIPAMPSHFAEIRVCSVSPRSSLPPIRPFPVGARHASATVTPGTPNPWLYYMPGVWQDSKASNSSSGILCLLSAPPYFLTLSPSNPSSLAFVGSESFVPLSNRLPGFALRSLFVPLRLSFLLSS